MLLPSAQKKCCGTGGAAMNACLGLRCISVAVALLTVTPWAKAQRTIHADVVALDQAFYNNRLGAFQAGGMIFALRKDVVNNVDLTNTNLTAGNVMLRP